MKKSDLKSGMVVSLRDWKEKFILIGNTLCSVTGKDFLLLDSYDDDDLKHNFNDNLDITEVYKCKYPNLMSSFINDKLELIWKREEDNNSIYEDYREAAKYNEDLCTTIAMEECAELIQAISKAKRGKLDKDNLTEEIADVMICADWIMQIYDISIPDIDKWFKLKEQRIVTRLNTGEFK